VVNRAISIVESMAALVIADAAMAQLAREGSVRPETTTMLEEVRGAPSFPPFF
jgi:chorismate synthase